MIKSSKKNLSPEPQSNSEQTADNISVSPSIANAHVMRRLSITDKLTRDEQQHLLNTLFGFDLVNVNSEADKEHWVLHDEEGYEFYGSDANCRFDFSTLAGIFSYTAYRAKNQGYSDCQFAMRKVLVSDPEIG